MVDSSLLYCYHQNQVLSQAPIVLTITFCTLPPSHLSDPLPGVCTCSIGWRCLKLALCWNALCCRMGLWRLTIMYLSLQHDPWHTTWPVGQDVDPWPCKEDIGCRCTQPPIPENCWQAKDTTSWVSVVHGLCCHDYIIVQQCTCISCVTGISPRMLKYNGHLSLFLSQNSNQVVHLA